VRSSQKDRSRGRNDPCWCGSGKKFKRCHQAELKVYVLDHPGFPDLWDTHAYDLDHAERSFRSAWASRTQAGGDLERFASFPFVFFEGVVGRKPGGLLCPGGCENDSFEAPVIAVASGAQDHGTATCKCGWSGTRQEAMDNAANTERFFGAEISAESGKIEDQRVLELDDWRGLMEARAAGLEPGSEGPDLTVHKGGAGG